MSDNSPYARIVRVLLLEMERASAVEYVRVNPRDAGSGFWSVNPVARIPALEVAQGVCIPESDLICRYLDAEFSQGRYYEGVARDARISALLGIAQSVLDRGVLARTEKLRPGGPDHADFIQRQLDGLRRGCDVLDRAAPEQVVAPGIVDIVVACAVEWFDFRHEEVKVRDGRPRLAAWCDAMADRISMVETRSA